MVGLGPGDLGSMTQDAFNALTQASLIVGYKVYNDLVRPHFPGKTYYETPMMGEVTRCRYALEQAQQGTVTALVCSGDAGIYGMAGLLFQLRGQSAEPDIMVIPGITAAISGAAMLGAPLTNDFAVISLSNLLTPLPRIRQRLAAAAMGDFCIVLYNPASKKRGGYLAMACDIMLEHKAPDTPCGVTRHIGREGAQKRLMTLAQLRDYQADMFTTVFIGNRDTRIIGGSMVTVRGYRDV